MIEPKGLDKIIDRIEDIMNYYGTEKYKERMKMLDESIFSRIMFDEPKREKELESGYLVRYYYYADEENCKPVMHLLTERYAGCLKMIILYSNGKIQMR